VTLRVLLVILVAVSSGWAFQNPDGAAIFQQHCDVCHRKGSGTRAPSPEVLQQMSRDSIIQALETGVMREQGAKLTPTEREAVAAFLSHVKAPTSGARPGFCTVKSDPLVDDPGWNGWGVDIANSRFQPAAVAGLSRNEIPKLKLKWAFGFPGAWATFGQPTVFGGRVFAGSEDGTVYSLNARTGCIDWTFKAPSTVKTAVSIGFGGRIAYFGDVSANVYAVEAASGSLLWKVHVDSHPAARITGSPVFFDGKLYVPVSSGEEGAAMDPRYPCCTFRGSVVALDAQTGKQIWKAYTIPQPAHPTVRSTAGVQMWGPSGAAVWSPPTIDAKQRVIYVATGNGYSDPPSPYSDAVIAFDLDSGKMLWSQQLTPSDLWNIACIAPTKANCPDHPGSDFDFGAPPILKTLPNGHRLLIAGQKSGVIYALDPDQQGRIVWQTRIGKGGPLGGIQWGGAADKKRVYFPLSDWNDSNPAMGGGLFALQVTSGKKAWYAPPPKPECLKQVGCNAAQMAPVTVIPGVVFSGSQDGHLRAYDTRTGKVIWDFDTLQEFKTVNGVEAHGGSMNATGPAIANGMLYVDAGYTNGVAGNVLLAFSVDGK